MATRSSSFVILPSLPLSLGFFLDFLWIVVRKKQSVEKRYISSTTSEAHSRSRKTSIAPAENKKKTKKLTCRKNYGYFKFVLLILLPGMTNQKCRLNGDKISINFLIFFFIGLLLISASLVKASLFYFSSYNLEKHSYNQFQHIFFF